LGSIRGRKIMKLPRSMAETRDMGCFSLVSWAVTA
jgi:hypothetical protein